MMKKGKISMKKEIKNMIKDRLNTLVSSADCKPVASGCGGSTPPLSTKFEKVKSPFSEKELLTMSFKEYWAIGLKESHLRHRIGSEGHVHSPGWKHWAEGVK